MTDYKWENVSVRVDRWKRLQALCEELEPHQHYDGQNECQVCDEPLTDTLVRHLDTLAAQRTALTPAQSGRGEPASPLLPGLERNVELQSGRDGVWVHCHAGSQHFSVNLDLDPMAVKFCNAYRAEISRLKGEGSDHE